VGYDTASYYLSFSLYKFDGIKTLISTNLCTGTKFSGDAKNFLYS